MSKIKECIGLFSSVIRNGEPYTAKCEEVKTEALKELAELEGYPCMDAFLFLRKCGFEIEGYYNSDHVVGIIRDENRLPKLLDNNGLITDWGFNLAQDEVYLPNQRKFISFKKYGYYHILREFKNLSGQDIAILRKCFEK